MQKPQTVKVIEIIIDGKLHAQAISESVADRVILQAGSFDYDYYEEVLYDPTVEELAALKSPGYFLCKGE